MTQRIITCQGTIQLVTALSVLVNRQQETQTDISIDENYLVIYDLSAPADQLNNFVALITNIATSLCDWKAIHYLDAPTLAALEALSHRTHAAAVFEQVYQFVGLRTATEIYLSRNWQFSNQLLMNAYASATKICYGDSIGIYFSANSSAFFGASQPESQLKTWLRQWRNHVQTCLGKRTQLETLAFDLGYFVLPTVMGEVPPMTYRPIQPQIIFQMIAALAHLVPDELASHFQTQLGSAAVAVLLTSNFAEAERMALTDELLAYEEFLAAANLPPETVLVIKPHPRDALSKIRQLQAKLAPLFARVIILDSPELYCLPFEIFFYRVLSPAPIVGTIAGSADALRPRSVQVFAVSSACLGLKLLFDVPSQVGFGRKITSKYFYPDYRAGRLAHEQDLTAAIQTLRSV